MVHKEVDLAAYLVVGLVQVGDAEKFHQANSKGMSYLS